MSWVLLACIVAAGAGDCVFSSARQPEVCTTHRPTSTSDYLLQTALDDGAAFGSAVACADDFQIAGAPAAPPRNGDVFAWARIDGSHVTVEQPPEQARPSPDGLGMAVAVAMPWMAVGAPTQFEQGTTAPVGAVHFWQLKGDAFLWQSFVQPAFLYAQFGAQMAFVNAQLLAVGMPGAAPTTASPSAAFGAVAFVAFNDKKNAWSIDQSVWGQTEKEQLGFALARVRDDAVAVGGPGMAPAGHVQIIELVGLSWTVVQTIAAPPSTNLAAGFGHSVAVTAGDAQWMAVTARTHSRAIWLYRRVAQRPQFEFAQQIDTALDATAATAVAFAGALRLAATQTAITAVYRVARTNGSDDAWAHDYDVAGMGGRVSGCDNDGSWLVGSPDTVRGSGGVAWVTYGNCTTPPATTAAPPSRLVPTIMIAIGCLAGAALIGGAIWLFVRWRRQRAAAYSAAVVDSWTDSAELQPRRGIWAGDSL